jgi:hypothetical protein
MPIDTVNERRPRVIDDTTARKLAEDLNMTTYHETSASYGLNVERVFQGGMKWNINFSRNRMQMKYLSVCQILCQESPSNPNQQIYSQNFCSSCAATQIINGSSGLSSGARPKLPRRPKDQEV